MFLVRKVRTLLAVGGIVGVEAFAAVSGWLGMDFWVCLFSVSLNIKLIDRNDIYLHFGMDSLSLLSSCQLCLLGVGQVV